MSSQMVWVIRESEAPLCRTETRTPRSAIARLCLPSIHGEHNWLQGALAVPLEPQAILLLSRIPSDLWPRRITIASLCFYASSMNGDLPRKSGNPDTRHFSATVVEHPLTHGCFGRSGKVRASKLVVRYSRKFPKGTLASPRPKGDWPLQSIAYPEAWRRVLGERCALLLAGSALWCWPCGAWNYYVEVLVRPIWHLHFYSMSSFSSLVK